MRREGPADGLIIKSCDPSQGDDGEGPVVELHVLNTEGRWQPALSLYEYVQQNVVEICSVWDEENPADAESSDDDGPPTWWRAQEVYEQHLHRDEPGDVAALFRGITPRFAGYIVEQRRAEVLGIRYFRVAAQRARVPLEVVKIIEIFAGLLPAKDSVPCRRDQLPAFMQRLVELYQDEDHDIHPTARVSSSIEVRGTTVWTGHFSGKFDSDDWTVMPRRLLAQYQEVPASLNEELRNWEHGDWPEGARGQLDSGPGYRTFLMEDSDDESGSGSGSESDSDDEAAAPAPADAESSSDESSSAGGYSVMSGFVELTLDWFDKRPWDYYLAVEHAWPPGCSIEDDVPSYESHGHGAPLSNTGFAVCQGYNKEAYAVQRSAKNAGRILGYSNFWYVSTANDCMRHRQLQETGTFDPFTDREIHYY